MARTGGGIYNDRGTLTLSDSTVSGNTATGDGGGGFGDGGGIYSIAIATQLDLINSTVSGNTASGFGGGIRSEGELNLTNSTVSGNTTTDAGGGINGAKISLTNSTVSENTASEGGGIRSSRQIKMSNSTITRNSAHGEGGGVFSEGGEASLVNTIISGNTASNGPDCSGKFISLGHNLLGNAIGCEFGVANDDRVGFQFGIDPKLGPLQDNGGPNKTHALLEGSPAIDAGYNSNCPLTDQRGISRPQGAACDIGAYEK